MIKLKNLISWIPIIFLWIIVNILPYGALIALGGLFSKSFKYIVKNRLLIAKTNIKLCFGDNEKDWKPIYEKHIISLGKGIFEALISWFMPQFRINKINCEFEGYEFVEKAINENRPIILLGAHSTSLEIALPLFSRKHKVSLVYKPVKNKTLEYIINKSRKQYANNLIDKNNIKQLIQVLNNKGLVWYAADQDFGRDKGSYFAPFFGVCASTLTLYAKLAKKTNAVVIPITTIRTTKGYTVRMLKPISAEDMQTNELAAKAMNKSVENLIIGAEEQYYWVHRRFKTKPNGEKRIYPKAKKKK